MVKRTGIIAVLLIKSFFLFSGDIATFVNLGFSPDSKYFMFGQYGIEAEQSLPYAEIYTVNVKTNMFTKNGVKKVTYPQSARYGQEGFGAFLTLFLEMKQVVKQYGIKNMNTGRVLYLLINGQEPEAVLQFRDFISGSSYTVKLIQSQQETAAQNAAQFYIELSVRLSNGQEKQYTIGLPHFLRKGVKNYRVRQIILSPDNNSLVFVVEKMEQGDNGVNVRYMVETLAL